MTDEQDNVVHVDFGFGAVTETNVKGDVLQCSHSSICLDAEKRTIACGKCAAAIDPFDIVLAHAERERRFRNWDAESFRTREELRELRGKVTAAKRTLREVAAKTAAADIAGAVAAARARLEAERKHIAGIADRIESMAKTIASAARGEHKPGRPRPRTRVYR